MQDHVDMSDFRAANRNLSFSQMHINHAMLVLNELDDLERDHALGNIESFGFGTNALSQLHGAKMRLEVAIEILEGEHPESKGEYPAEELSENTGGLLG